MADRVHVDFTVRPFDKYTDPKVKARIRKNAKELWRLGYSQEQIQMIAHVNLHGPDRSDNVRHLIAERLREIYRMMRETGKSWVSVAHILRREAEERMVEGELSPDDDPLVQMGYIEVH